MIVYFDTSAIVPILVAEPSTAICRRLWNDADRRVSSRLTYVEVSAALAQAERLGRLSSEHHDQAWTGFTEIWADVDVVELSEDIVARAADCARAQALRGYDAVHCASAVEVNGPEVVAVAGDHRLLDAWQERGVAVVDTNDRG